MNGSNEESVYKLKNLVVDYPRKFVNVTVRSYLVEPTNVPEGIITV